MKVTVIGTGYVGLVSGTCFAEIGHEVTCVDLDQEKIEKLRKGISPIYEPGLNDLLERNINANRLHFSIDYSSVPESKVIFLAVGTPSTDDGQADLKYLDSASKMVAEVVEDGALVVIKSTVPVGTHKRVEKIVKESTDKNAYIINNPEFLKEGSAVEDFMRPDRVIIGHANNEAADVMDELYAPLVRQGNPIFKMSNLSAEMSKYAANCFLATKISFINEVAQLCDRLGADIEEVRKGIMSDVRIGRHFLYPGPGYGGSCFPKDVKALMYTAKESGMDLSIIQAAEDVNENQKVYMAKKIESYFQGDLSGKTFAFWGVAFKPNTDDIRESPAIAMAKHLVKHGAKIKFYDPVASDNYKSWMSEQEGLGESIAKVDHMYECVDSCDGLVIVTEWREFKAPDFSKLKERLSRKVIFDARNIYETSKVLEEGFEYFAIGKKI